MPPGRGIRCHGFTTDDGGWAHCSREELAGPIGPGKDGLFSHRLRGICNCGVSHEHALYFR